MNWVIGITIRVGGGGVYLSGKNPKSMS